MRARPTVRVLLLDRQDRLLMMHGRLPSSPEGAGAWFVVGGGVEPGESLIQAALREIREEAGIEHAEFGPVVWRRRAQLVLAGDAPSLLVEDYLVARCEGGEPDRSGWNDWERTFCDEISWLSLNEISRLSHPVYPERLVELLPAVIAGAYPEEPLDITVVC